MADSAASANGKADLNRELMLNCNKPEKELEENPEHEPNSKLNTEQQTPQAWGWSVTFLCFYGFMVQLKPGESFITPNLLSTEKNFTRDQVSLKHDCGLFSKRLHHVISVCISPLLTFY